MIILPAVMVDMEDHRMAAVAEVRMAEEEEEQVMAAVAVRLRHVSIVHCSPFKTL